MKYTFSCRYVVPCNAENQPQACSPSLRVVSTDRSHPLQHLASLSLVREDMCIMFLRETPLCELTVRVYCSNRIYLLYSAYMHRLCTREMFQKKIVEVHPLPCLSCLSCLIHPPGRALPCHGTSCHVTSAQFRSSLSSWEEFQYYFTACSSLSTCEACIHFCTFAGWPLCFEKTSHASNTNPRSAALSAWGTRVCRCGASYGKGVTAVDPKDSDGATYHVHDRTSWGICTELSFEGFVHFLRLCEARASLPSGTECSIAYMRYGTVLKSNV